MAFWSHILKGANKSMNNQENLKLSAPWEIYCRKVQALFSKDPEIAVSGIAQRSGTRVMTIQTCNMDKYNALMQVFPTVKFFGDAALQIDIRLPNEDEFKLDLQNLMEDLFDGNEAVDKVCVSLDPFGNEQTYVMFKPEVMQFFNDNIRDYNGICTTVAENLARDVLEKDAEQVNFCTTRLYPELL